MKKGYLLLLMMVVSTATTMAFPFEGVFTDERNRVIYEIATDRRDVMMRRGQYGEWQRFIPHGRNQFVSRNGDILEAHGRNVVLHKRRYSVRLLPVRGQNWNRYHNHRSPSYFRMDGQYFSECGRNRLRIQTFRNGIKVQFLNQRRHSEFFHLVNDWDRVKVFRADCGETISISSMGELVWRDTHGRRQLRFYK